MTKNNTKKAISVRSRKAKGRRLQNKVRDDILAAFPGLVPGDVKPAVMGETGMDIKLSGVGRTAFPYAVECRNVEKVNIWKCIADAERHGDKEGLIPATIIARNNQEPYIALPWDKFIKLLGNIRSTEEALQNALHRARGAKEVPKSDQISQEDPSKSSGE